MKLLHQENPNIRFHCRHTLDFPQHTHDVMEVVFVHRGTATVVCGSQRYELSPGDLFVAFPNQPHGYENSRDIESDVLIVPTKPYLSPWRNQIAQAVPVSPVIPKDSWQASGVGALLDIVRPEYRALTPPVLQGYAMVIIGKLLPCLTLTPKQEGAGDSLNRLLRYISEHYREPLSRGDIAQAVGYNESYISHIFTEQFGMTLKDYLTSLRLRDARELLSDQDMTISRISVLTGFGSIRSFNRAFARQFGVSPSDYRLKSNLIDTK